MRIALAQINRTLGDVEGDTDRVLEAWQRSAHAAADLIVSPRWPSRATRSRTCCSGPSSWPQPAGTRPPGGTRARRRAHVGVTEERLGLAGMDPGLGELGRDRGSQGLQGPGAHMRLLLGSGEHTGDVAGPDWAAGRSVNTRSCSSPHPPRRGDRPHLLAAAPLLEHLDDLGRNASRQRRPHASPARRPVLAKVKITGGRSLRLGRRGGSGRARRR